MYSETSDYELLQILKGYALLTFEAQLSLKEEIRKRDVKVDLSDLERAIAAKMVDIRNLVHLKDFGFEATRTTDGIKVERTKKAVFTDVFAILLGLCVFVVGIYGVINLVMTFINGDELDVFTLAFKAAMASLLFIGFSFFSGLKRIFDYAGFELSNHQGSITLKKRFDVKLEEIKAKASDVLLDNDEDILMLRLGEQVIFTSNADNVIQTMTLQELTKALKKA